jgi:hypothetical protein
MSTYFVDQRVAVFDPLLQHDVPGFVTASAPGCVLVSLDDRMVPVAVDPADHHRIQPIQAVTHA